MCFRAKRNRNMYLFVTYRILVQEMFIASLWKELILRSTFLLSLSIKYGLIIVHENCYVKYFKRKKQNEDVDDNKLITFNSVN